MRTCKRTIGLLALIFGSTILAATMSQDQAVDELMRMDADFQRAVGAKDAAAVAKFLADDFILITGSSRILTKQELLREIASPTLKWEMNASREVRVRVHGDAAVVTALLEQKGVDNNERFDSPVRYTDTWIRENGEWRQISGHASPVKTTQK
jgi:ketosteroid isomerase-like protein